jgi:hypothetical protein
VDADAPDRDDEAEGRRERVGGRRRRTPMTMFERNPIALVFSPFSPI